MKLSPLCKLHGRPGRYVLMVYISEPVALEVNDSFAFLWERLSGKDFVLSDVRTLLEEHFALEPDLAREEAERVIALWQNQHLMTD